LTINNNQYGKIIERLRSEHGISQDTLANILLINTDTLQAVEKGIVQLSDSQLSMCANIFDVSKFALENGEIRPRIKRAELQFNLDKLLEQYNEAVKSQSYMLEAIQQAAPPERYEAKYSELQEYYIQGYFVYDTLTDDFVRDKDNFPVKYDTAKEALDAARRMDEFYKNATLDKSLSADNENKDVNVTESVTQQEIAATINNLEYDDEGYLHFTVETDGYELEGLFRVNDPQNGKSMELVSIDYGYLHPEISKQWNQIEDHLKNEAVQYLEKQNIENNISEDYAETAFRM
jgi:DNA-binding XRE family transcriptional regulator